jgi:hypothetical protein
MHLGEDCNLVRGGGEKYQEAVRGCVLRGSYIACWWTLLISIIPLDSSADANLFLRLVEIITLLETLIESNRLGKGEHKGELKNAEMTRCCKFCYTKN